MTKNKEPDKDNFYRLPVCLTTEDNRIFTDVKHALEQRTKTRLSAAEVVRIAIRTQAKAEGVSCK